jgi:hypothetical protein
VTKRRDTRTPGERWIALARTSRATLRKLRAPEANARAEAHRRPIVLAELREVRADVGELIAEIEAAP